MTKKDNEVEFTENVTTPGGDLDNRLLEEEYLDSEKGKMNTLQFCLNLMKGIAGTGSLSIPFAFAKVGIIPSLVIFTIVCAMMILATFQLLDINNNIGNRRILVNMMYSLDYNQLKLRTYMQRWFTMFFNFLTPYKQVLGTTGYKSYMAFSLITLYGSNVGSMIAMTDFLVVLPLGQEGNVRRLVSQIILTVICIGLCLLKDPTMLVPISSLGLVAIFVSYIIMIIFGVVKYKPNFEVKDLWPCSFDDFLSNIGLFVYCMGFILFLLTQYKYVRRDCRKNIVKSTAVSIAIMAILYSTIGIVLSQYYKNSEKGVSDNILLSFPKGTTGMIINLLMCITVAGGFPLWMEPINETIEGEDMTHGKIFINSPKYITIRVVEICLISIVAFLIPKFSLVLNVIGSFTDVLTTFIYPAVMHIVFFRNKTSNVIMTLNFVTLIISVFIMIVCTSIAVKKAF